MRFLLMLWCLSACDGLPVAAGNAYPCDFSKSPGTRDEPCAAGDVCSINNVCVAYIYEGPRMEGGPRATQYMRDDFVLNSAVRIHPGSLDGPVLALARDVTRPQGALLVRTDTYAVQVSGTRLAVSSFPSEAELVTQGMVGALEFEDAGITGLVGLFNNKLAYAGITTGGQLLMNLAGDEADLVRLSRASTKSLQAVVNGEAFDVGFSLPPAPPTLHRENAYGLADVRDVTRLTRFGARRSAAAVLTDGGLHLEDADGGYPLAEPAPLPWSANARLSADFNSTVLTAHGPLRLATWQIGLTPPPDVQHTTQQAWPDCRPCPGSSVIEAVTPLPQSAGLGVEVLCRDGCNLQLLRVTGSNAVLPSEPCVTQPLELPFDVQRALFDTEGPVCTLSALAHTQRGFALGGARGEVWTGETISSAQPIALDRVPLDVTTIATVDGRRALLALTGRYIAALDSSLVQDPAPGFRRVAAPTDLGGGDEVHFIAAVRGTDGWGLLDDGTLAWATVGEQPGEGTLTRGPKLVTPSGVPVSRSSGGEAFVDRDGGLRALFVTGDDGLYAVGLDGGVSSESLTPKLQPEPSVPIRSLALERTPLGTAVDEDGGVQRARGYLVTSRNVYEWQYGGSPPRWSSRLLVLGGGEPVEVWFDSPRSALGRVGYSDGQIYTLPGGYQLAGPLGEGGEVLDFENLGGWPVALTTDGVFAAAWPLNDDGSVNNRFDGGRPNKPMDWHRLTLPAGVGQSPGKGGRLFVQSGELVEPVSGQPRPGHKLFLFLSDEVLELASFFP